MQFYSVHGATLCVCSPPPFHYDPPHPPNIISSGKIQIHIYNICRGLKQGSCTAYTTHKALPAYAKLLENLALLV